MVVRSDPSTRIARHFPHESTLGIVSGSMSRTPVAVAALLGGMLLALHPEPVAAAGQAHGDDVDRVLQLTNAERVSAGRAPLAVSQQLSDAAQSYSQVLASGTCFDHSCGAVPNFADRLGQVGYAGWRAIAENIAAGYPTPDTVVARAGWLRPDTAPLSCRRSTAKSASAWSAAGDTERTGPRSSARGPPGPMNTEDKIRQAS
jgi:hypothetical protein